MPLATLCQRCALCCDGALFAAVPLSPGDADIVRARGLVVLPRDHGAAALPQPCRALQARRCTIYGDRPGPCRSYRCMLLVALDAGEVSLPEAEAVVDDAHARLDALAAALPGAGPVLPRARAAALNHMSLETRALMDRAADFLARRFRGVGRR